MTHREVYILGWVFGRLHPDGNTALAAMRPFSAMGEAVTRAHREGILKGSLDKEIGAALCQLETHSPDIVGGSEKVQPHEMQSSWYLGYYAGLAGSPLPDEFDIAAARKKKGLTQAQLAELVGVDQALVSRWESGKVHPNEENVKKLKEILL